MAADDFVGMWQGNVRDAGAEGTVIGTILLGFLAPGRDAVPAVADARAAEIWRGRFG